MNSTIEQILNTRIMIHLAVTGERLSLQKMSELVTLELECEDDNEDNKILVRLMKVYTQTLAF